MVTLFLGFCFLDHNQRYYPGRRNTVLLGTYLARVYVLTASRLETTQILDFLLPSASYCLHRSSVQKNNTQERAVNVEVAVIFDVAELPEFVHEEVYATSRCANHFR